MVDTPDWEDDGYDKYNMLGEFQMERDQIESLLIHRGMLILVVLLH